MNTGWVDCESNETIYASIRARTLQIYAKVKSLAKRPSQRTANRRIASKSTISGRTCPARPPTGCHKSSRGY